MTAQLNVYGMIAPARMPEAELWQLKQQRNDLIEAIMVLDDQILDASCDLAELDRERSAYEADDFASAEAGLVAIEHGLVREQANAGWLLAHTLIEMRNR